MKKKKRFIQEASVLDHNTICAIYEIDQTQEDIIEAETPLEVEEHIKPKKITKPYKRRKPKRNSSSLDLF